MPTSYEQLERSFHAANREIARLSAENAALKAQLNAFRNVDDLDWELLLKFMPDSGHGRFWKAVFSEFRAARKALHNG